MNNYSDADLEKAKDICRSDYHSTAYCNSCDDIAQAFAEVRRETAAECMKILQSFIDDRYSMDTQIELENIAKTIRERFLK